VLNLKVVTTSWDDGDPRDLRVAELLRSRDLRGTFYVPITGYQGGTTLAAADLRALSSEGFEIGAHSVSHRTLPRLGREEQGREVRVCKQMLEQMLGSKVSMFCYPNGRYNDELIREVQNAGYEGARTTRMLSLKTRFSAYEMPTTVQAYPHHRTRYVRNLGRAHNIPGLVRYVTELRRFESWVALGKRLFSQVLEDGGIWHLYGHSWEIDELGIWDDLSEMLDHVAHREGVTYATNGQLLSLVNRTDGVSSLNVRLEQCPRGPRDKEKQTPCPR
jgi:peptidoglycan-N-acetylglucosamine deacetylase